MIGGMGRVHETIAIEIRTTESLTEAERAAVIDVCVAAHDEDEFRRLFTYIPSGGRHFLLTESGVLVAHAVVTMRWLQPEGHPPLETGWLDAVSTLPSHQNRGLGSKLIARVVSEIDDFVIAGLQTDRPDFYRRVGWELWRGPLAGRDDDGLVPTPDQHGVMVYRLASTPPLDLDTLLTIERQPTRFWE